MGSSSRQARNGCPGPACLRSDASVPSAGALLGRWPVLCARLLAHRRKRSRWAWAEGRCGSGCGGGAGQRAGKGAGLSRKHALLRASASTLSDVFLDAFRDRCCNQDASRARFVGQSHMEGSGTAGGELHHSSNPSARCNRPASRRCGSGVFICVDCSRLHLWLSMWGTLCTVTQHGPPTRPNLTRLLACAS